MLILLQEIVFLVFKCQSHNVRSCLDFYFRIRIVFFYQMG